jgi:hypothetical protein
MATTLNLGLPRACDVCGRPTSLAHERLHDTGVMPWPATLDANSGMRVCSDCGIARRLATIITEKYKDDELRRQLRLASWCAPDRDWLSVSFSTYCARFAWIVWTELPPDLRPVFVDSWTTISRAWCASLEVTVA